MNIPKALEILEDYVKPTGFIIHHNFDDALRLGIEALKRVSHDRITHPSPFPNLLPGETEE